MSSAQQQSPDSAAKQIAGDSGSISNNNNNKPIVESTGIDSLRLSVDPHAMVDYFDEILGKLESQFENMANQVLKRMEQMGGRIDQLERSICDLIAEAEQVDTDSSAATSNIFKQLPAVKVQKESQ